MAVSLLILVAVLAVLAVLFGGAKTLVITVPTGFRGELVFIEAADGVKPKVSEFGKIYSYSVGPQGRLNVQSLKPFLNWHNLTAQFDSGEQVPNLMTSPEGIGISSLGYRSDGTTEMVKLFVGKKEDLERWRLDNY